MSVWGKTAWIGGGDEQGPCLTFSSPNDFTLAVSNNQKRWNGVIEYSTDLQNWLEWDASTRLQSDSGKLYVRGKNNSHITYGDANAHWYFDGSYISCDGNIETLLDYRIVRGGGHPTMDPRCFYYMFYYSTGPSHPKLIKPPKLPAKILPEMCYYRMFSYTDIDAIPEIPAETFGNQCCAYMFDWCRSLMLSETQTGDYQYAYRIPTSGEGTAAAGSLISMFNSTGGTFTGTPTINTTYYTTNPPISAT